MVDVLSLKESILIYLDISGGLQKLMEDCKSFNGTLIYLINWSKLKKRHHQICDNVATMLTFQTPNIWRPSTGFVSV